jgi:hypothetical protein
MRTGFLRHVWIVAALASVFCLWPEVGKGQATYTSGLTGTVVDPSGAVIPGATVTITDPATNYTQTVTANGSGVYTFSDLQPATYQMKVSAKGFADALVAAVIVQAARVTSLKVAMKVGAATETVEVSGQGQVLETTTNTLATTISPEAIQDLPLAGRDALQFAELVPGATYPGQERYTTMDDLPAAALNITVNGTNDNFTRYRSTTTGFFTAAPLRIGAFDEMTVSTAGLTSDAGAEGSTTLTFVTKRGTNQFHGNAFWEAENSFFNANTYTNNAEGVTLPKSRLNDYGGSLGGPLWKNHLFFFANFEWETSPSPYTDSGQVFTTGANAGTGALASAEAGNFTYQETNGTLNTVNLLSIAQANGFPSTVNSVTQGLMTQMNNYAANGTLIAGSTSASPGAGQCCQMPNTNTLLWQQPFEYKLRYPTARLDYQVTPKISLHEAWDLQWFKETGTPNYPGNPLQSDSWKATYFTTNSGFDWTISPTLLNQFSFGTESTIEQFNPTTTGDPFASQADEVINPPLTVNPVVPGFILNAPRDAPQRIFTDNLTWTRGNHTFTFGGSVDFATMYETEVNDPPTYGTGIVSTDPAINMFNNTNFPNIDTANNNLQLTNAENLYAFLVGRINGISGSNYVSSTTDQYQQEGRLIDKEAQTYGGIYFQDSWHMSPHLTLNYGLRWEMTGDLYSTNNFWTSPTYQDLLGPSGALFQPGVLSGDLNPAFNLRPHPYSADLHQPAPNIGIAWNPDVEDGFLGKLMGGNKTVIRAGGRISYYNEGWATIENSFYTNPGGTQSVFLEAGSLPNQFTPGSLSLGGTIPPLNSFPSSFKSAFPLPEADFTFADQNLDTIDPNIRPPYIESWNLGIQRQLPGANVFEVDYVANHGVHEWLQYDLNEVNIFENGFLNQFKTAQGNLANNGGTSFVDTGAGDTATPIFDTAFAGQPSAFTNSTFINYLQTGQAGALAAGIAGNPTYFCNMVGANFGPCGNSGGSYPINFFQANPYATGQMAQLLSDPGNSTYNSLQVQWKHPTGHGLFLGSNYTYSHGLTNRWLGDYYTADEVQYNFTTLRDPQLNKGPSPYDVRNQFKLYYAYDLPFGKNREFRTGNGIVDNVIGGWTWGGVVTAASGLPFKLLGGTNTFNYSFASLGCYGDTAACYPDGSDSGVVLNGVTLSQLQKQVGVFTGPSPFIPAVSINPNFLAGNPTAIQPESTPGQLGQFGYLKGPMSWDVDFSLKKAIPIYERVQFNLFAEFLNAFNHPIWDMSTYANTTGGPGQPAAFMNVSTSNFSELGLVNTPRTIEFRLQMAF